MDFDDLQQAILDDLSVTTSDQFYSTALIKRVINRAMKYVANKHNWEQTQKSKTDTITASQVGEYINYPENFKQDSTFRLSIAGDGYKKLTFPSYQKFKEDNPNDTTKVFSDWRNRIFVNPSFAEGDEVTIWGHEIPADMSSGTDTHPFTTDTNLEEAMIKVALSILYKKGRGSMFQRGQAELSEAEQIIEQVWRRQRVRQSSYLAEEAQMFNTPDLMRIQGGQNSNNIDQIGKFSI